MTRHRAYVAAGARAARPALLLMSALLAVACGASAGPAARPEGTPGPSVAPTTSAPVPSRPAESPATAAPSARIALTTTADVPYEGSSDLLQPGTLDVYAPDGASGLPVVVMLHGSPSAVDKSMLGGEAAAVARAGAVVLVADWGHLARPGAWVTLTLDEATAVSAEVACAVAFAAEHAADYGGDPRTLVLFGHSGGGMVGAAVAFGEPSPSTGCLADGGPARVTRLVTWDGDFLLGAAETDAGLAAEPGLLEVSAPWSALDRRTDLPAVLLVSDSFGLGYERPMTDGEELEAFLRDRDHEGVAAAAIAATDVLDDGALSLRDESLVLEAALLANGNPVRFGVLPGATHSGMGALGWPTLVEAIFGG